MKKILILMTAVFTLAACDKEKETVNESTAIEREIFYTVADNPSLSVLGGDGITAHLTGEAEWDALLDQFCDYARSGEQVMFCSTRQSAQAKSGTSNTPTSITTSNREELKTWMKEMEKAGKTVRVTYDNGSGTWNGTAYINLGEDSMQETRMYSGTLAFVATPVLETPPLGGSVMALQVNADSTLIITVHGMMMWNEQETPDENMSMLIGAEMVLEGVVNTYTDLEGNSFMTLDINVEVEEQ